MAKNDQSGSRDRLVSSSSLVSPMIRWSDEISRRLIALQALPRIGDPRAGVLIEELSELANEGERRAEKLTDRRQQIEWLEACYAVKRRQAVWQPVWEVVSALEPSWMVSDEPIAGPQSIEEAIRACDLFGEDEKTALLEEIKETLLDLAAYKERREIRRPDLWFSSQPS